MTYTLILLGATFIIAYFAQRFIAEKINVPSVAVFMILGVVLGQSGFNLYNEDVYKNLGFISDFVLGIISFIIGTELSLRVLKKLGKAIIFIALGEVIVATIFVIGSILLFTNLPTYTAIILGAVASATAPAATVYVIRQYKCKGPLSSTILGVVGIDDAFSLIIYAFAAVIAQGMLNHASSFSVSFIIVNALSNIGISVVLGITSAIVFYFIARKIKAHETLLILIIGFIVLLTGISHYFDVSQLLTIMTFGIVLVALNEKLTELTRYPIELIYEALVPLFFILAGSTFLYKYALASFTVGLIYTVSRIFGKYLGGYIGAALGGTNKTTRNFVGLALFPQVGVAFGLAIVIQNTFAVPLYGEQGRSLSLLVTNILIWTTFITETVGPILTRFALGKAKEIGKGVTNIPEVVGIDVTTKEK